MPPLQQQPSQQKNITPSNRNGPSPQVGKRHTPVSNPSEGAQIIGCELYQKLQTFLETYLEKLLKVYIYETLLESILFGFKQLAFFVLSLAQS